MELTIRAVGRTVESGLELLEALQARKDFERPFPTAVTEREDGVEFTFTMQYVVNAAPEPAEPADPPVEEVG